MAVGTTADFGFKRNQIIAAAFRKIRAYPPDGVLSQDKIDAAVKALNAALREEDLEGTGLERHLWALDEKTIQLAAKRYVYGANEGLNASILDLIEIHYRDTSGDDSPVDIITAGQYERLIDKDETGDVKRVYLKEDRLLASQLFYIHPAPATVGTTSEVTGTDAQNYRCIMGHTSAAENRPITGASWRLYWEKGGSSGVAWVTGTAYTNGELVRYLFKRPLFDFDAPTDDPDFPKGWDNYLIWRLAWELSPDYEIPLDERVWLERTWRNKKEALFPSKKPKTTDFHNKACYF